MNPTAISLKAGCELFLRYTTRTSELELSDIERAKARLIEVRGAGALQLAAGLLPDDAGTNSGD